MISSRMPMTAATALLCPGAAGAPDQSRLTRLRAVVKEWRRRSSGRRTLANMPVRSLQDIGITPYDALIEINKPFWRA